MPVFATLSIITLILLVFDYYCYNAIISTFKKWKPATKKLFKISYWTYTTLLIIGVFCAVYFKTVLFLSLKSIILVAFFLTMVCKFFMLPFLLIDDLRRLVIKLLRGTKKQETTKPA